MSTPLVIGSADPGGMSLLDRIDPRFLTDETLRAHVVDLLSQGLSWIAASADDPVGFAVVTRNFFNYPFVDLIVVREDRRRLGVARALLAHCEASHLADRIFTSTNESNAPMRAVLADLQWRPCGQVDALDEGDPELFYVRFKDR